MNHDALRKAAILVATLDTESADALLSEMAPEQAALIRNAVMELGEVNIVEQDEIVEDFVGKPGDAFDMTDHGVEIDPSLAQKFADEMTTAPHQAPEPAAESATGDHAAPFAFLTAVAADDIARALEGEHPQTTAIIAAHLPPEITAEVLEHLPPHVRTETLMRVARLSPPHPDILKDLEQEMQSRLANRKRLDRVGADGLARVEAILQNASNTQRQAMVADLTQQDRALATHLRTGAGNSMPEPSDTGGTHRFEQDASGAQYGERNSIAEQFAPDAAAIPSRPTLDFADLEQFDDASLVAVLQRSSPNSTLLALAGASHAFVRRILSQLKPREATQLENKIQRIGPLRLDDVQRAQQQMAATAQQLIDEGHLTLPGKQRLSVAA